MDARTPNALTRFVRDERSGATPLGVGALLAVCAALLVAAGTV